MRSVEGVSLTFKIGILAALLLTAEVAWAVEDVAPVFSLRVQGGQLQHRGVTGNRPVARTDVTVINVAEFGGAQALRFQGATSSLTYAVSDWPELRRTDEFTYRVRFCPRATGGECFIAGRPGVSFLILLEGWAQGQVSPTTTTFAGGPGGDTCVPGRWYDAFLRFRPLRGRNSGDVNTWLFDAVSGRSLGKLRPWGTRIERLADSDAAFHIGQGDPDASFVGDVLAVDVWDRYLTESQMQAVLGTTETGVEDSLVAPPRGPIRARAELRDAVASRRWKTWLASREAFPLAAWGYFHRYTGDVEEYRVYREANLTMGLAPITTAGNAERAGVAPILGLWQADDSRAELYQHPDRLAAYVKMACGELGHCAGYMLADEPNSPEQVAQTAGAFAYIYRNDPRGLPMVNLLPFAFSLGGGYEHYVEAFIRANHPPVILSDTYCLGKNGAANHDRFYANIEIIRRKALEADIGFMGFVLTTGHGSLRTASESDIHWQANSLLAYGAHGLWFYNYRIASGRSFDDGLVSHVSGKPTRNFDYVRCLNAGILANGQRLMRLRTTGVFHCHRRAADRPVLTEPWRDGSVPGLQRLEADNVLLGTLEELIDVSPQRWQYLTLVNKRHGPLSDLDDPACRTSVGLEVRTGWTLVRFDNETGRPTPLVLTNSRCQLSLAAGDRALLRLEPPQ